ncbi:MAG: N-acetyltransferase [Desulfocapsa sp.]|nr:N-acetyltransferase [Desulfocapsa sp.]
MIRNAKMGDVKGMHSLLNHYADQGQLLGRSFSSLYDKLRDFKVFVDSDDNLLGVCALNIIWEDLAEVRSLAVREDMQGQQVGRKLVRACLEEAEDYNIKRVFTLTYQAGFFRKQGFKDIDKSKLPHKIWSDCLNCTKFPDCDEEALQCTVSDVL